LGVQGLKSQKGCQVTVGGSPVGRASEKWVQLYHPDLGTITMGDEVLSQDFLRAHRHQPPGAGFLRVIPMGRRAWLFCWTELGAKQVGIVQSPLTNCRLHDINPYYYLVDVLQRVGQHPSSRVAELTPWLWKEHFAANPLRSDLYNISN
jgi:hypothetical protein